MKPIINLMTFISLKLTFAYFKPKLGDVKYKVCLVTENREQRTENREQRTENREQRTENRDSF
jgi:hypothetical protein